MNWRNPEEVQRFREFQDNYRIQRYGLHIQHIYDGEIKPDRQNRTEMMFYRQGKRDRRRDATDYDELLRQIYDGFVSPDPDIEEEVAMYQRGQIERMGQQCKICNKVGQLYQCAECKDSAYCGEKCQILGCGNKHF
jgi:hypothetical protein